LPIALSFIFARRGGEIGIRTRLKIWREQSHVGSTPTFGILFFSPKLSFYTKIHRFPELAANTVVSELSVCLKFYQRAFTAVAATGVLIKLKLVKSNFLQSFYILFSFHLIKRQF
jgi:hypothetical protein